MKAILPLLHGDALTVTGKTVLENVAKAKSWIAVLLGPWQNPGVREGG